MFSQFLWLFWDCLSFGSFLWRMVPISGVSSAARWKDKHEHNHDGFTPRIEFPALRSFHALSERYTHIFADYEARSPATASGLDCSTLGVKKQSKAWPFSLPGISPAFPLFLLGVLVGRESVQQDSYPVGAQNQH
jgi:hypothetical protein